MNTMERKENSLSSKLFSPNKDRPMQFVIITKNALTIECTRVRQQIEKHGGEFMGYDLEHNLYINLASPRYQPPPKQIIFDIKYIKRCVIEKKLLDLHNFQINGERLPRPCAITKNIAEDLKCNHCHTAEEVLEFLKIIV